MKNDFFLKRFLATSLAYGITGAIPSIVNILILPVIEGKNKLTATDFSQVAIFESIIVLFFLIVSFSGGSTISRFYYEFREENTLKKFISTFFLTTIFRGSLLVIGLIILQDIPGKLFSQSELQNFSMIGIPASIIGINRGISNSLSSLFRNTQKKRTYIVYNISTSIIRGAGMVCGLFFIEMSIKGYIYGSLLAAGIILIFTLLYIFYHYGIQYKRQLFLVTKQFTLPVFFMELVSWIMIYIDRFLMEPYPETLGIYETSMRFFLGIRMIIQGFNNAFQPDFFYLLSQQPINSLTLKRMSNNFIVLTELLVFTTILPTMFFLHYFCDSNIANAYQYIPFLFILLIPKAQIYTYTTPILFEKNTKILLKINLISVIFVIICNLIFIPFIGIYAPIIAIALSDLFIVSFFAHYKYNKQAIYWNHLKTKTIPFILVGLGGLLEIFRLIFNINPFIIALIVIFLFLLIIYLVYKTDIRTLSLYHPKK